ncbi:MAG: EamA family transporter RarD [Gemmataceae bacterium]|nr:EamA family transporter RarD [Gemmataceae bacterium]
MTSRDTSSGLAYGLFTYIWWGLMPIYFRRLDGIPAGEILACRIVSSLVVLATVIVLVGRSRVFIQTFSRRRLLAALSLSTLLIAINWYFYTLAVCTSRLVEASLGYFIQPLLNAAFGAILFKESFRPLQRLAVLIALSGLVSLVLLQGQLPWIACVLALSFGLYSTLRKATPVDGLVGLSVETLVLSVPSVVYLVWLDGRDMLQSRLVDQSTFVWLWSGGLITALPLVCFGQAARRLRLSTLGFLQYISPSIQFGLAVFAFGETFDKRRLWGFGLVWLALAVYSLDVIRSARVRRAEAP